MSSLHFHLAFPINVYTHIAQLEKGHHDYLHLCSTEEETCPIDLLLQQLPSPPCHIISIGEHLDAIAHLLTQHHYTLTKISTDLLISDLDPPPLLGYQVLLLHEWQWSLDNLTLFNRAYDLLDEKGKVIIINNLRQQRPVTDKQDELPVLNYTLAQAERCGFELTKQYDLTQHAEKTTTHWLNLLTKYHSELLKTLSVREHELAQLQQDLQQQQLAYRTEASHYYLLHFSKTHIPRWKMTTVTPQDEQAVATLFNDVFAPAHMDHTFWQWKYGEGRGLGIAAYLDGKMIAHYGGIMRQIYYFGLPKTAVQITDVMVQTKERGVFKKHGSFFLTTASFLENYIGYGNKTWVGYGFPSERHLRLANRLGLYDAVGKIAELYWDTTHESSLLWSRIRHLHPKDSFQEQQLIEKLWKKMAKNLRTALVPVRNWQHILHRYLSHPSKKYEILLISRRFTGKPLAIVVISREGDVCKIMDYIGSLKHIPVAIRQMRRVAGLWGMKKISVWITENFMHVFPEKERVQLDPKVYIPHNTWSQTFPPEEINNCWWLMAGDTDYQ